MSNLFLDSPPAISPAVTEVDRPADLMPALRAGAKIAVWRAALDPSLIERALDTRSWPLEVLALRPGNCAWRLNLGDDNAQGSSDDVERTVGLACSMPPHGNAHAVLAIRAYGGAGGDEGSEHWWRSYRDLAPPGAPRALLDAILDLLERARAEGLELVVEEISVVVSHDAGAPLATLTPTLHADEHYGRWAAALASACDASSASTGTTFAPTLTMHDVWDQRPINMASLVALAGADALYRTASCDLALYSGMRNVDGAVDRRFGAPHISSDFPGSGARLVLLLRRRNEDEQC